MNNLFSANGFRMKKNKLFWVGVSVMAGMALLMIYTQYHEEVKYGIPASLDDVLMGYCLPITFVLAVFCSFFLGTEYSDGAIRNKLIVGHTRNDIYFVNLLTNFMAALLLCLAFAVAVVAIGIPVIGISGMDGAFLLKLILGSLLVIFSYCSLFTMVNMICGNKAAAAIINVFLVTAFLLLGFYVKARLEAPQYMDSWLGGTGTDYPNPQYLTGMMRKIFEFLLEFLPGGQLIQYINMEVEHAAGLWRMPLYSALIIAGSTAVGALIFKRKNIK